MMNAGTELISRRPMHVEDADHAPLTWALVRRFLARYTFVILVVFGTTVLTTYLYLLLITEQYDVSAKLLVKVGRENVDPPPTVRSNVVQIGLRPEEINSEIQILTSPDLMAQIVDGFPPEAFVSRLEPASGLLGRLKYHVKSVVRIFKGWLEDGLIALNLKKRLNERDKAIVGLLGSLDVMRQRESDVIGLSMRTPDPALGVTVLDKLIAFYLQRRLEVRQNSGVKEFFDAWAREAREQLQHIEGQIVAWKLQYTLSLPEKQASLLLEHIRALLAERALMLREIEAVSRQITVTKKQLQATPREIRGHRQETPNPSMQTLRDRVTQLRLEKTQLLSTYRPEFDRVQNLNTKIQRIEGLIEQEETRQIASVTYDANPLSKLLEEQLYKDSIQLEGVKAKATLLAEQQRRLESELQRLEEAHARLVEFEREQQIAKEKYVSILQRKQDADSAAALDRNRISSLNVLMPPIASIEPVAPRKLLLMGVACVLGLGLGVALSLLLYYLDDRVRDPAQLEATTGLPCLGAIVPGSVTMATPGWAIMALLPLNGERLPENLR